jgi:NHL repeat
MRVVATASAIRRIKFSPDGVELMRLGKAGVSGSGPDLFHQPNGLVVAPSGDIFVTESQRPGKNSRVVKSDNTGRFHQEMGL